MLTTLNLNKQQMAEWLAVKLLGWEARSDSPAGYLQHKLTGRLQPLEYFKPFIDSPDGMDSVWDAFEEKYKGGELPDGTFADALHVIRFSPAENRGKVVRIIISHIDYYGRGDTRIEAFYNAVYEVMNDSNA